MSKKPLYSRTVWSLAAFPEFPHLTTTQESLAHTDARALATSRAWNSRVWKFARGVPATPAQELLVDPHHTEPSLSSLSLCSQGREVEQKIIIGNSAPLLANDAYYCTFAPCTSMLHFLYTSSAYSGARGEGFFGVLMVKLPARFMVRN